MPTIHCAIHNNDIFILHPEEEYLYCSNDSQTVVMFDSGGTPYPKRYRVGECDVDCPTMKSLLAQEL